MELNTMKIIDIFNAAKALQPHEMKLLEKLLFDWRMDIEIQKDKQFMKAIELHNNKKEDSPHAK